LQHFCIAVGKTVAVAIPHPNRENVPTRFDQISRNGVFTLNFVCLWSFRPIAAHAHPIEIGLVVIINRA
jgi:hypothetical protein